MATAEIAAGIASEAPAAVPLRTAAGIANRLWRELRDAYNESAAAAEQVALEELLESVARIERRLFRLAACAVLHPNASHPSQSPPIRPR